MARPLKWLTAFYNRSTTFDLNIGKYDPFGNDIPGAGGKGKDYGLRIDLPGDKLALRVNKYENSIGPINGGGEFGSYRDTYFNIENRVLIGALEESLSRASVLRDVKKHLEQTAEKVRQRHPYLQYGVYVPDVLENLFISQARPRQP